MSLEFDGGEVLACSICGVSRYKHDVVSVSQLLPAEADALERRRWTEAIGKRTLQRLEKTRLPVVCVEHFATGSFDRRGRPILKSVPIGLSGEEISRNEQYMLEHAYTNLSAPYLPEPPGGVEELEHLRAVCCSLCSALVHRPKMVSHAAEHCAELLDSLEHVCLQHEMRRKICCLFSTFDIKFDHLETTEPCGKCNLYRRFQHYALCELVEQAALCFPIFIFEAASYGPERPDIDARITFYLKPDYIYIRQTERSTVILANVIPKKLQQKATQNPAMTLADLLDEITKNDEVMRDDDPWLVHVPPVRLPPRNLTKSEPEPARNECEEQVLEPRAPEPDAECQSEDVKIEEVESGPPV